MRPKFILNIMVITLAFFMILLISPDFWRSKAMDKAAVTWIQDRTPENERALQFERDRVRRSQYVVCSLAVLNVMAIIVYGGLQQRKGKV